MDQTINNAPVTNQVPPNTNQTPQPTIKYAGFWIRFVAFIFDGFVMIIPLFALQFIVAITLAGLELSSLINVIVPTINTLASVMYFTLMTHYKGATLGKMMVGITVKSEDFNNLSFSRIIFRESIGRFISSIILFIGYIIAGFTKKKQALHDMMVHSVVVYKDPAKPHTARIVVAVIIAIFLPILFIVGIISSITLVSLGTAREKAQDAIIRSTLGQIKSGIETYGYENNSYSKAQDCNSGVFSSVGVEPAVLSIPNGNITCYAEEKSYAISSKLENSNVNYCLDSTGFSGEGIAKNDGLKAYCERD